MEASSLSINGSFKHSWENRALILPPLNKVSSSKPIIVQGLRVTLSHLFLGFPRNLRPRSYASTVHSFSYITCFRASFQSDQRSTRALLHILLYHQILSLSYGIYEVSLAKHLVDMTYGMSLLSISGNFNLYITSTILANIISSPIYIRLNLSFLSKLD